MNHLYTSNHSNSRFHLFTPTKKLTTESNNNFYTIIYNTGEDYPLTIDGICFSIKQHSIITLTPSHHFTIEKDSEQLHVFRFNDSFYCVDKHDKEVSCIGYIFYGSSNLTNIALDEEEQHKFGLLLEMFEEEFQNRDNIQGEMLTILLKRLIIKCTRLARKQQYGEKEEESNHHIIRQFNILIELNFRTGHTVSFYANQMGKSVKTLSKILLTAKQPSPIKLIQNRLLTEARRQLLFTDKSIKEIAYGLNFTDIQTFSRFFKSKQGVSPVNFKKGITDNK